MGLSRPSKGEQKAACIRSIDKGRGDELEVLEARLKIVGGYWRIHRTVNARDVVQGRVNLMVKLLQYPEKGSCVDSEWRTALLQSNCIYGDKKFMLDIDTQDADTIKFIEEQVPVIIERHKSPKGWHYITEPFDTRVVCTLDDVTLIRDGYYFIKEVGERC